MLVNFIEKVNNDIIISCHLIGGLCENLYKKNLVDVKINREQSILAVFTKVLTVVNF